MPRSSELTPVTRRGRRFYFRGGPDAGRPLPRAAQARLRRLTVPPAWTDVAVSLDAAAAVQAAGTDKKGRRQRLYSVDHERQASSGKFERVLRLAAALPKLRKKLAALAAAGGPRGEAAAALLLIERAGFRTGSDDDTKADVKAVGATNLSARHVSVRGDTCKFEFVGKKGVAQAHELTDAALADLLRPRVARGGRLFKTDDDAVRALWREVAGRGYRVKDLRTARAAGVARRLLDRLGRPKNAAAAEKQRSRVARAVARALGNTPAVALESYIPPEVFEQAGHADFARADFAADPAARGRLRRAESWAAGRLAAVVVYEGLHPESAELVNRALACLVARYGRRFDAVRSVRGADYERVFAGAASSPAGTYADGGSATLLLNRDFFDSRHEFSDWAAYNTNVVDPSLAGVLAHEYGHLLTLRERWDVADLFATYRAACAAGEPALSAYSRVSADEMLAEGFAAVELGLALPPALAPLWGLFGRARRLPAAGAATGQADFAAFLGADLAGGGLLLAAADPEGAAAAADPAALDAAAFAWNPEQPRDERGRFLGLGAIVGAVAGDLGGRLGRDPSPEELRAEVRRLHAEWDARKVDRALAAAQVPEKSRHGPERAALQGQARKAVAGWLKDSVRAGRLTRQQAAHCKAATHDVLDALPTRCLERFLKKVSAINYHGTIDQVTDAYHAASGTKRPEVKKDEDGVGGFWSCYADEPQGELDVDGGKDTGERYDTGGRGGSGAAEDTRGIYAHEFFHAIDGPSRSVSNSPAWQAAWSAEIGRDRHDPHHPLTRYASKSAREGLAEYGRLLVADPATARRMFPRSWAALAGLGLVDK